MLALILWLALGWRAGAAEIFVEAGLCVLLLGGGGGGRVLRTLRELARPSGAADRAASRS